MSTPTVNATATQGLARVVDSLEHQVHENRQRPAGPPEMGEVLSLAESMRLHVSGDAVTSILDGIWAAQTALDEARAAIDSAPRPTDLLELTPDEVAAKYRDAAQANAATSIDSVGFTANVRTYDLFSAGLARSAADALKGIADEVVKSMRRDFTKHVKVVTAAADLGLSEHTVTDELLSEGSDKQIAAYRALPAAVTALESLAGLRNQMTGVLHYGPPLHPVHSFVTVGNSLDALSAANRYDGTAETVQYNTAPNGSMLTKVQVQRLGGRWLALATLPGVELRLNTAAEVQTQYEGLA